MVGAAGFEPATAGLENLHAYSFSPYPSVFSASSLLPMVRCVPSGCDLLQPNGHDFGQHLRFERLQHPGLLALVPAQAVRAQFALYAQTASVDRSSNRLSIFNVIDHFPASVLPIVIPALSFVSIIDSDKDESTNVKAVLEIVVNKDLLARMDLPITVVNGRLLRVVVNFQGIPVREAGPVTFCLTVPNGATAEHGQQC
jgi:hypothetical protein